MLNNLADCVLKTDADVPLGVVLAHLAQVADVADVIADAVVIHILINLRFAGIPLSDLERLPD